MQWASEPQNESKFHLIVRGALGIATADRNMLISRRSFIHHDNYFNASINLTTLFPCAATLCTCLPVDLGKTEGKLGLSCCDK